MKRNKGAAEILQSHLYRMLLTRD